MENWKTSQLRQVMACLGVLAMIRIGLLAFTLNSLTGVDLSVLDSTGSRGHYLELILFGVLMRLLSIALIGATLLGLGRKRAWALPASALIAVVNLPTLLFPISLLMGWYLTPDSWREWFRSEVLPQLKREIGAPDPRRKD